MKVVSVFNAGLGCIRAKVRTAMKAGRVGVGGFTSSNVVCCVRVDR